MNSPPGHRRVTITVIHRPTRRLRIQLIFETTAARQIIRPTHQHGATAVHELALPASLAAPKTDACSCTAA